MKHFFSALLLSLVLVSCQSVSDQSSETKNAPTGPVEIGGVVPLSGEAAPYGKIMQQVFELRAEQINEKGGVNGRDITFVWEDGKCTPGQASQAVQKLLNVNKLSIIIGGCSGEMLGMAPITEKSKAILFGTLSTSPEITHAGDFVFRTAPSDSSQGRILGEYANAHFPKVGMLSEQTDYAMALRDTFESHYTGELLREDYLSTESDFKNRITKLKNQVPDALFINVQTPNKFEIIMKQLQEQNVKIPIMTNEVPTGNMPTIEKFSDYLVEVGYVGGNFVAPESQKFADFLASYEQAYGERPQYEPFVATTIDAMDLLAWAIGEAGSEANTEAIRDKLYGTQDYPGYANTALRFDENGDVNIAHSLFRWDGENMVLIED